MVKIKKSAKKLALSVVIILHFILMAGPLGAENTVSAVSTVSIIEQGLQQGAAHNTDSTPEEQVRYWLQQAYVDPVPEKVLNADSIDEMILLLGDPHTSFMTPEQYSSFVSPGVTGIGIYMEKVPQGILVHSLIPGSPAEEEGLQAGDIISRVKEHQEESWIPLVRLSLDQAGNLFRGPAGSKVDLTVIRSNRMLYFTLVRKKIEPPPISASFIDPAVAYLELNTFFNNENQPTTASLFAEALQEMELQGAQCYILDLRDNGGGYVGNALNISGFFIGNQQAMQVIPPVTSETGLEHTLLIVKPVVVLINQNTASASEILSGALKDYNCALFLGQKTYGKGCMQGAYPVFNQGSLYGYLKMTTARFYSPLGHAIDQVGIDPHIKIRQNDPLLAARLLLSAAAPTEEDSSFDMVKVVSAGREYGIDINRARQLEYWPVYSEIIDNTGPTHLMLPGQTGWVQASSGQLQEKWPFYYPEYHPFPKNIVKHPGDPIYITFSQAIDPTSAHSGSVELRDKESGESIDLVFQLKNECKLQLIPQNPLQPGREYWLIIHPGDQGIRSHDLQLTLPDGCVAVIRATHDS